MLKITLWFDQFDTEEQHFEYLKNILLFTKELVSINIVGILYNQDIGKLLHKYKENITDVSFLNLNRGTKVKYNDLVYSLGFFNIREAIIKNGQSTISVQFGDFELFEAKNENMVS